MRHYAAPYNETEMRKMLMGDDELMVHTGKFRDILKNDTQEDKPVPPINMELGACADELYETRQRRLALQKEVDLLKKRETCIKNYLIETLPKSEATGVSGSLARVTIVVRDEPVMEDADVFYEYLHLTKRYDLAYKPRPSAAAIRDIWGDGEEIPGVGHFGRVDVSLNKV